MQVGLAQTGGLDCNFQNDKEEDPNAIGGIREGLGFFSAICFFVELAGRPLCFNDFLMSSS